MSYVMHLTTDERKSERKGALLRDHVWRFRHYDGGYKSSDTLLTAMERAFHELALKHPDSFKNLASELQQSDFETVHYLLVRGYRANGQVLGGSCCTLSLHPARYLWNWLCGKPILGIKGASRSYFAILLSAKYVAD